MIRNFCLLLSVQIWVICVAIDHSTQLTDLKLWVTVSAQRRQVVVSWINARINVGDEILITNQEPGSFEKIQISHSLINKEFNRNEKLRGSLSVIPLASNSKFRKEFVDSYWISNGGAVTVLETITPTELSHWYTTTIPFDFNLSKNVTVNTHCYGYWASYVDKSGKIISSNCIQAFPKWMNEMRSAVGGFRLRDLFIPGTHDSGSYRPGFDPLINETIVTKYSLTQDEDIEGQLMHGARYLDIRVGYYRASSEQFWANHGISRQRPLREVLEQILGFVLETNEIVIVDIQEFPVGFGKNLEIHRRLVQFMHSILDHVLVDPNLTWQATLRDIWQRKQNVILCYDHVAIVNEFPTILFRSVEQKWGNVQTLHDLDKFLRRMNELDPMRLSSRPTADMAELTPDTWGVITDKFGGLRRLADQVNQHVTNLYRDELGHTANIVAVDFIRSTSLVDIALYWNLQKVL